MPINWDEFEAVDESPAVDWSEFESAPVTAAVAEKFPPLTPGAELGPELRRIAAPPGLISPQPEKSFLQTITAPPTAPRFETIKGGPPVIPGEFKSTLSEIGEEFGTGLPRKLGVEGIAPIKEYPATLPERIQANTIFAPITAAFGEDVATQIPRSLANQGIGLADFMTSPLGLSTAVGGGASKAAKIAAGLYFTKDLAGSLMDQAKQAGLNWDAMDAPEKADAIITFLATGTMATGIAKHTGAEIARTTIPPIARAIEARRNIVSLPPEIQAEIPSTIPKVPKQPTPRMREIKPEEQKDAVTIFDEEASSPTGPLSNAITQKAGLSITKVSDFDRLAELKNQYEKDFSDAKQRYTALPKEQQTIKELEALTKLASRAQYAREVIETATNTGGWVEGGLTNIGERPLDWQKNPEAAEWLRKNGEKVGIELPDKLNPKEVAQPEAPAEGTVRVYHGEGGAEGAGFGGFSVSKDPVYAARFGPRQSFVDVPASEFERMQKEAREKGEPTNLKLSEQYQKQLKPVEKPIEMPIEDLDKEISPAPEVPPPAKPPEAAVPPTAPPEPSAPAEPNPVTPMVTEEPALIGQGPGAMTRRESSRPAPPEPSETIEATGLKNAIAEMERVSYGFGERSLPEKQAMAEAWQRAGRTLHENPEAGRELAQALMDNPRRGLTGDESALILRHKVALENAINNAAERSITGKGEAKVEAQAALDRHRAELSGLIDAVERRGTEWGREGRWRQALAYEDYSFATQERLLTASKGRPLTDTERTALQQQLADYREKLASLEKHNKERDQKLIDSAVKEAIDRIEKQGTRVQYAPRVIEVAENFAKYMDRKAEDARARLAAKFSRTSAGIDPTILSDVIIIGTAKLARGAVDFAKWSDAMIKDLGPGVKDYLKSAWTEVGKTLDAELTSLEKTIGKPAVEKVRQVVKKVAPATPQEKVTDIAAKTAAKFKANDLSTISPLVRKLARHFVETGVRGREAVIDAVHAALKTVLPSITRSDTMRMIAGYGEYRLLPKDQISVLLRGYKGEMQQIAKLEDIASGKAPEKTGVERRAPTAEERRLIKEVEEAKKKGGYTVTDPATQLRTAMDAVKTRLQNQIADLEIQIAKREKIVKEPTKLQYDEAANRLKARRDELKREFDEIFPKEPITEVERLRRWKERTQNRIDDLNEMLRTGDIEAPQKRAAVKLDAEGNRLQAILEEAKVNIQHARERAEWERMSIFQKAKRGAIDTYDAARLLMTTGEFSFILRQGKWTFLSRPLLTLKAIPEMFQAMRGWRQAHEADLKIFNHPDYAAAKEAKLHLINESASLSKMEEIFAGRWAHAIPVVSNFNRAARVFLNKIRFDTWQAMRKSLTRDGTPTPAEDAQIAMFVNESTGRGSLGFAEQAAIPLGRAFFAPRYVASRFQLLAGHSLWKGNARSRRIIATEYARTLIGLGIYYSLLNAMFSGDKDKKPVTLDSRSSDFGKIVVGNTRIDPLAGLAQAATFIGRTVTGETKTQKGRVIPIRKVEGKKPRYGDPTWSDVAARFARSKMHPIPGAVANLFEGTSMDGAETTIAKETGNLMGPITYFDIYKALSEQDIPDAVAMSLLALLGEGLQTYNTKK